MIQRLYRFDTSNAYQAKEKLLPKPYVVYVKEESSVFYSKKQSGTTESPTTTTPIATPEPNFSYTTPLVTTLKPMISTSGMPTLLDEYIPELDGEIKHIFRNTPTNCIYWHNIIVDGNTFVLNLDDLYVEAQYSRGENQFKQIKDLSIFDIEAIDDRNLVTIDSIKVDKTKVEITIKKFEDYGEYFHVLLKHNDYVCQIATVYITPDNSSSMTQDEYDTKDNTASPTGTPTPTPTPTPNPSGAPSKYPHYSVPPTLRPSNTYNNNDYDVLPSGVPIWSGEQICYANNVFVNNPKTTYSNDGAKIVVEGYITVVTETDHTLRGIHLGDERLSFGIYDVNDNEWTQYDGISVERSTASELNIFTSKDVAGIISGNKLYVSANIPGFDYSAANDEPKHIPIHIIENVK